MGWFKKLANDARRARDAAARKAREAADAAKREAERKAKEVARKAKEAAAAAKREAERKAKEAARKAKEAAAAAKREAERVAKEAERVAKELEKTALKLAELAKAQLGAALDILRQIADLKKQLGRIPSEITNIGISIQLMVSQIKQPFETLIADIESTFTRIGAKMEDGLKLAFSEIDKIFTEVLPAQINYLVATGFGGLLSENEKDQAKVLMENNGVMSHVRDVTNFMSSYVPSTLSSTQKLLTKNAKFISNLVDENIQASLMNTEYTSFDNPDETYIKSGSSYGLY